MLPNWMRLSLAPDEVIGSHKMLRWCIIPNTRFLAIYLHKHQSNDPRTPHDHPADNISIRLRGELFEYRPTRPRYPENLDSATHGNVTVYFMKDGSAIEGLRPMPRIAFRRAEDPHRLECSGVACWTIWIRFRVRRPWGYFEPSGWRRRRLKPSPLSAVST